MKRMSTWAVTAELDDGQVKIFRVEAESKLAARKMVAGMDVAKNFEEPDADAKLEITKVVELKELKGVHEAEGERWQRQLTELLSEVRPSFVYRIAEEILVEVEEWDEDQMPYDPYAGSGLPEFIVADHELGKKEMEIIGRSILSKPIVS